MRRGSTRSGDHTFQLDRDVDRTPVRFKNHFGIEIAADLYVPRNRTDKLPLWR